MDPTHKRGLRPIDIIAALSNVIECIEGYQLLEVNEIIISKHKSYLVDINFK